MVLSHQLPKPFPSFPHDLSPAPFWSRDPGGVSLEWFHINLDIFVLFGGDERKTPKRAVLPNCAECMDSLLQIRWNSWPLIQFGEMDVGKYSQSVVEPTHLKNMLVKMGSSSPGVVNIKSISKPPPRFPLHGASGTVFFSSGDQRIPPSKFTIFHVMKWNSPFSPPRVNQILTCCPWTRHHLWGMVTDQSVPLCWRVKPTYEEFCTWKECLPPFFLEPSKKHTKTTKKCCRTFLSELYVHDHWWIC